MSWALVLIVTEWAIGRCASEDDLRGWAALNRDQLQAMPPPIADQVRAQWAARRDMLRDSAGRAA